MAPQLDQRTPCSATVKGLVFKNVCIFHEIQLSQQYESPAV